MRKPQHSISGKLLTVLLIFALPITIFVVQHTRGVHGTASSISYTVYEDALASGWTAQWWASRINLANTSPVYSGGRSISFTPTGWRARLYLHTNTAVDTTLYSFLHFAAQANQGGQHYNVMLYGGTNNPLSTMRLAHYGDDPVPGIWKVYTIPLSDLRANATQIRGVAIENRSRSQGTLYLASISLTGFVSSPTATPTPTQVSAPTEQPVTNVTTSVNQTNGSNTANQNDNNNTTNNVTAVVEAAAQATPTATPTPTPVQTTGIWKPALNTSWQWQLTTPVDQSINVAMYDVDGFDNTASIVSSLHAQGRKVVCYIDAGTYENWRSDANQFPSSVKGSGVQGWAGEQWLDIRNLNVLGPIMQARLDMCKRKGFDGVEFDNVDGYTNDSGFPLTAQDQLTYNTWLANQAHARGMSAGLKNDLDQVKQLLPYFDWALDEQCFQYNECDKLTPFISAGKAVFEVEYDLQPSQFCNQANAMNFNSLKKNLDLDAPRTACR